MSTHLFPAHVTYRNNHDSPESFLTGAAAILGGVGHPNRARRGGRGGVWCRYGDLHTGFSQHRDVRSDSSVAGFRLHSFDGPQTPYSTGAA